MADRIIQCIVRKDQNDQIDRYNFNYEVEAPNDATVRYTFLISILAGDMMNPFDESEARTKANVLASVEKSNWLDTLNPINENIDTLSSVTGEVTL